MADTSDKREVVKFPNYHDADGVLTCPRCGCQQFEVSHTYNWSEGFKKRRRVCEHCRWPVTTTERVDEGV